MFSSRFMLFPTFLEEKKFFLISCFFAFYAISNIFRKQISPGGQNKQSFVVLASEPVGGRSRVTELPCLLSFVPIHVYTMIYVYICHKTLGSF